MNKRSEPAAQGDHETLIARVRWLHRNRRWIPFDVVPAVGFFFYPKDWRADSKIRRMSLAARGVHMDAIADAWFDDVPCSLSASEEDLADIFHEVDEADRSTVRRQVLRAWVLNDGRIYQPGLCKSYLSQLYQRLQRVRGALKKHQRPGRMEILNHVEKVLTSLPPYTDLADRPGGQVGGTSPAGGGQVGGTSPAGGEHMDSTSPAGGKHMDSTSPAGGEHMDSTSPAGGEHMDSTCFPDPDPDANPDYPPPSGSPPSCNLTPQQRDVSEIADTLRSMGVKPPKSMGVLARWIADYREALGSDAIPGLSRDLRSLPRGKGIRYITACLSDRVEQDRCGHGSPATEGTSIVSAADREKANELDRHFGPER